MKRGIRHCSILPRSDNFMLWGFFQITQVEWLQPRTSLPYFKNASFQVTSALPREILFTFSRISLAVRERSALRQTLKVIRTERTGRAQQ